MKKQADFPVLEAAHIVLRDAGDVALTPREIYYAISERRLIRYSKQTQYDTIRRLIDRDIENCNRQGTQSRFRKDGPGRYSLNRESRSVSLHEIGNSGRVLVFRIDDYQELVGFHGVRKNAEVFVSAFLENRNPEYITRSKAENSDIYKQIVSYVLLINRKGMFLSFRRHPKTINREGEFVDGAYSIGIGGHVQENDRSLFATLPTGYLESVQREIFEETKISVPLDDPGLVPIGVLNDDSTPRGQRHFAFLHIVSVDVPDSYKESGEEDVIQEVRFVSLEELSANFQLYEYWSKLCLLTFFKDKLSFTCHIQPNAHFSLQESDKHIVVVGEVGSGKSKACRLLERDYGYTLVPCSLVLKEALQIDRSISISRRELQDRGLKFVGSPGGHEEFAQALMKYIDRHPGTRYVLDGLRYPETLDEFLKLFQSEVVVIYLYTLVDIRYENFKTREGNETMSFSEFLRIADHPVEKRIHGYMPRAQIVVYNQETLPSFERSLTAYFDSELGPIESFLVTSWDINAQRRHDQLTRGIDISFSYLLAPLILDILEGQRDYDKFRVLDIGCGTGVLSELLSEHVEHVTGVDPSSSSIEISQHYCAERRNVRFACSPIESYGEHDESSFDFAVAHMVLHTIPDGNLHQALSRVYELMRSKSTLIISIPHPVFYPQHKPETFSADTTPYNYSVPRFYRHHFTISNDSDPLPSPTPYFHRSIEQYTKALSMAGFLIKEIHEPSPGEEVRALYPAGKNFDDPNFLLFECVKL